MTLNNHLKLINEIMIRNLTPFLMCLLCLSQVLGQSDYLVTEVNTQNYSDGDLTDQDTTIYSYDSQDRVITAQSLTSLTQYSYDGNISTWDYFLLPGMTFINRVIRISNDDGFPIVYSSYNGTIDNLVESNVDSIFRNAENLILNDVSYFNLGNGLSKTSERSYTYNTNGSLSSEETRQYYDDEIVYRNNVITTYNFEGYRERVIDITEDVLINTEYSDTTNYFYENGGLESTVNKNYGSDGFRYCEKKEYSQVNLLETVLTGRANDLNCIDYNPTRLREDLLNEKLITGIENGKTYEFDEFENQVIYSEIEYLQNGILGDDEISVSSSLIFYEDEMEAYKTERNVFYKKAGLVANVNILLSEELVIYNNLVEKNSLVS
jgi:hypothetical protein